jgi:hypothetical protein
LSLKKKIGDDVIAQKAVTSFKQVGRHRMAFFTIKSTCPSDFLKNITLRYYEFCSKFYVHTVVPVYEKVLEVAVKKQLQDFCAKNSVINKHQSGFQKNNSCDVSC